MSEPEVLIHKDDLEPLRDPAESRDHDLAADAVRALAVSAAPVLYTRRVDPESLRIDRRRLIPGTVHRILLGLDDLVHPNDKKDILRSERICCHSVCISVNI